MSAVPPPEPVAAPSRFRVVVVFVVLLGAMAGAVAYAVTKEANDRTVAAIAVTTTVTTIAPTTTTVPPPTTTVPTTTTTTLPERAPGTVPGFTVGQPWGSTVGLTMFRGNPTRTFYGTGPLPSDPEVLWSYPADGTMCGSSSVAGVSSLWCGSGWTG